LNISDNKIKSISGLTYIGKNLETLNIEDNCISGQDALNDIALLESADADVDIIGKNSQLSNCSKK